PSSTVASLPHDAGWPLAARSSCVLVYTLTIGLSRLMPAAEAETRIVEPPREGTASVKYSDWPIAESDRSVVVALADRASPAERLTAVSNVVPWPCPS